MINFHTQRTATARRSIATALVLLLLAMQSTLSYLVTPMTQTDDGDGKVTIMLCTLQGLQEIQIDLGDSSSASSNELCPALELHEIIATGVADAGLGHNAAIVPRVIAWAPRPTPDYRSENYPAFSGRAPPWSDCSSKRDQSA
jgi:hypothetical protein